MTTLEKLRSLAESLNSPQSKRRDTMAGVLYEARREVAGILAEMEAALEELCDTIKARDAQIFDLERRSREALTLGRDAVMESFDYVSDKGDQMLTDMRLQSIDAVLAAPEPPALAVKTDGDRNE